MKPITEYLIAFVLVAILIWSAIAMQPSKLIFEVGIPPEPEELFIEEPLFGIGIIDLEPWRNVIVYPPVIPFNLTVINATCHQVVCECAKNTPSPCMAYCMECEKALPNRRAGE